MQIGAIDRPADLLWLDPDLQPVCIDWLWVGVRAKESGDSPAPSGLRAPAKVTVKAWWDDRLVQGRYLRFDGRLLYIDDVRDPTGDRVEVVMTASELVGQPAEYRPAGLAPVCCRVHLRPVAPYVDDDGRMTDYQLAAQVALIEVGRIQVDDQLVVAGRTYNVIDYVNESDDGVVRSVWLEDLLCG